VNRLLLTRSIDASVDRVWEIVGDLGASPGPGIDVQVERPGSADGTGLVRIVTAGRGTIREEITGIGPGPVLRYRMVEGAPVRDYTAVVTLDETAGGGTLVSWTAEFRPVVPGTRWAISLTAMRTLNRVLDAIAQRSENHERSKDGYTSRA
jgi:Polyketide cyclase / dehydrase and lipid transport